jgi:DNA primase
VSTPLRWEELTDDVVPERFTMAVVLQRVGEHGDLFAPTLEGGQSLGNALKALG